MQNIVLITNKIFHYRIPVYDFFSDEFKKIGYNFIVLTNEIQKKNPYEINFQCFIIDFRYSLYTKKIKEISPCIVILFLHLKDTIFYKLILLLKQKRIPFIYWTHGANLSCPNNKFKNFIFNIIHSLSDAIIIYSPNEKKYIRQKNSKKCFVAKNTINFIFLTILLIQNKK